MAKKKRHKMEGEFRSMHADDLDNHLNGFVSFRPVKVKEKKKKKKKRAR